MSADSRVRVQHAQRGSARAELRLGEFMHGCEAYFSDSGRIVDQPFQPRHAEGMVRCYLLQDRVAGFGHQLVTALMDPIQLESAWVLELQRLLHIDTRSLPALWDADFLLGPKTESGRDTYVLCEINVSAVFPFPAEALESLARAATARMGGGP